ncbi:Cytochrome c oxidase subunit 4 [Sporothrix stenoceras]|uniref:Cytochrome c oxidase subunit 4 n=1 Tax=Sporothrix stenoceras TaxID=5173 RepID=A0ABR3Z4T5_9PEZI
MFMQRAALTAARRAAVAPVARRAFTTSFIRREAAPPTSTPKIKTLADIKTTDDLLGPGAQPGTVPTDLEQSTGIERLEILGKMEDVDVFDMRPLDASRKGTVENPILVRSAGDEQYAGCTGFPVDSHNVIWVGLSRERPVDRCSECGNVYKMNYVGPQDDGHGHHDHHHGYEEPKTFANFVKPEYW